MKYPVLIGLLLAAHCSSFAAANEAVVSQNILKWPRMNAAVFGCYLEKTFKIKDKKFNCGLKKYVNKGDVCEKMSTTTYYEGPSFPDAMASKIHPLVEHVELTWEHGDLQDVSFHFKKKLTKKEIVDMFALPAKFSYPKQYPNVMSIDIQDCSKDGNCLGIQGFDHMGAGDVDCDEPG